MDIQLLYRDQIISNLIIKSATENGTDKGIYILGYASVYNVADQHNDLIIKGAFAEQQIDHQNVKLLWQHDCTKPIGLIQSLAEDDYGLKIEGIINHNIETGREAIELVRQGAVDGLSVGFNIKLANYNNLNQRIITKAQLVEVSIVTFPANYQAKITHITKTTTKQSHDFPAEKQDNLFDKPFYNKFLMEQKMTNRLLA